MNNEETEIAALEEEILQTNTDILVEHLVETPENSLLEKI